MAEISAEVWKKRIIRCKEITKEKRLGRWLRFENFIHNIPSKVRKKKYFFWVNYAKYISDINRSAIYAKYPEVLVRPRPRFTSPKKKVPEDNMADIFYAVLNYYPKVIELKFQDKLTLMDTIVFGTGFQKMGWRFKAKKPALLPIDIGERTVEEQPTEEGFWCMRVKPRNIYIDPEADNNLDSANYIVHLERKRIKEVKDTYGYEGEIKPSEVDIASEKTESADRDDPDNMRVWTYEITDRINNEIVVLCDNVKEHLARFEIPYDLKGFNYVDLKFNEPMRGFWGIPEFLYLETVFEEMWDIISDAAQGRRTGKRKMFVDSTKLDEEKGASKALKSDDNDAVVFTTQDPNSVVKVVLPTSQVWTTREEVMDKQQSMRELAGIPEFQYTSRLSKVQYAEEVKAMRAEGNTRADEKIDIMFDFKTKQMRKTSAIIKQFTTKKHIEDIIGDGVIDERSGRKIKFEWKDKKNIQGQFNIDINVSTMTPPHRGKLKDEAFKVMQMVMQFDPEGRYVSEAERKALLRYLVNTFEINELKQIMGREADTLEKNIVLTPEEMKEMAETIRLMREEIERLRAQGGGGEPPPVRGV